MFPAIPRTEKAWLLLLAEAGGICFLLWHSGVLDFEAGGSDVEPYAQVVAELLNVTGVGLVLNILHPDMQGFYLETGMQDARALGQHFEQKERILAARKSHEDMITIFYKMISSHRLDESLV